MLKIKSHFIALIGEEEFSLEAKAALGELTANMALIIKVITSKHMSFKKKFVCVYLLHWLFHWYWMISLGWRFSNFFCQQFDLKYLLEILFTIHLNVHSRFIVKLHTAKQFFCLFILFFVIVLDWFNDYQLFINSQIFNQLCTWWSKRAPRNIFIRSKRIQT